jgi:hypothetical protein
VHIPAVEDRYILLQLTIMVQYVQVTMVVLVAMRSAMSFAMRLTLWLSRASRAPPRRLIKAPGVGITAVLGRILHRVLD